MQSFKELVAWQKGMDLSSAIYRSSKDMPKDEVFGLRSQLRRAAISVPANIAEGFGRGHTKEYVHFLGIAMGSLCELETLYLLALREQHITQSDDVEELIRSTGKLLVKLRQSLNSRQPK